MPPSIIQTAILFAYMALGFLCARLGILNRERDRGISALLVKVTLPCLVFSSMIRPFENEMLPRIFGLIAASFGVYAVCIAISLLGVRAMGGLPSRRGAYRYAMVFSNAGFMGFPVLEALFGKDSLFYASVYNIAFQVLAFSVGVTMLGWESRKPGRGGGLPFINPNSVAALAGLAFFLLRIELPGPLYGGILRIGEMTTPLSMMFIGSLLSRSSPLTLLRDPRLWIASAFRVVGAPLLVFAVLKAVIKDPGFPLYVPVMIAAMPAAANTAILAEECGGDSEAASMLVTLSTVLSLATIPIAARFLFKV